MWQRYISIPWVLWPHQPSSQYAAFFLASFDEEEDDVEAEAENPGA
jgi:hypothetical protein